MSHFPSTAALALAMVGPSLSFASTEAEIAELRASLNSLKSQYEGRIRDLEARLERAEKGAHRGGTPTAVPPEKMRAPAGKSAPRANKAQASPRAPNDPARPVAPPNQGPQFAGTPATTPEPTAEKPAQSPAKGQLSSWASAFNPQISVILNGNYYQDGVDGRGAALVGEAFQPALGAAEHDGDDHGHSTTKGGFNFAEAELAFSATVDPYFDAQLMLSVDGGAQWSSKRATFRPAASPMA